MDQNSCPEFPKLSEQDLRFITLGSYQVSKASAYATEHIRGTGRYKFQICTDNDMPGLLRVNIKSRHKSHTQYKVYIKNDQNGEGYDSTLNPYNSLPRWRSNLVLFLKTALT